MEFTLTIVGQGTAALADLASMLGAYAGSGLNAQPAPATMVVTAPAKPAKAVKAPAPEAPAESAKTLAPEAPAEAVTSAPVADAPAEPIAPASSNGAVTIEQVRAAVQAKAQEGKREQVKALLAEFEVENVTKMHVAKYAHFLERVNAL